MVLWQLNVYTYQTRYQSVYYRARVRVSRDCLKTLSTFVSLPRLRYSTWLAL